MDNNRKILNSLKNIATILDSAEKFLSETEIGVFENITKAIKDFAILVEKNPDCFKNLGNQTPELYKEIKNYTDTITSLIPTIKEKIESWKQDQLTLIGESRKSSTTIGKYQYGYTSTSHYFDSEAE